MCYKDLVFRVVSNATAEPCAPEHAHTTLIILYSFTSVVLFLLLVQSLLGAALTSNSKARYTLLAFSAPNVAGLAMNVLVATNTLTTGEDGTALVVLFGVCITAACFTIQWVGVASFDKLAEISLQAVDQDTRKRFQLRPSLAIAMLVLRFVFYVNNVFVFFVLCVAFPLSPVGLPGQFGTSEWLATRQFWWDLGLMLAQFLGGTMLVLFALGKMYVVVKNLQTSLSMVESLTALDQSDKTKEYLGQLKAMIFKIQLLMISVPPVVGVNLVIVFHLTYISGVEPQYYLVWLLFTSLVVMVQVYANVFFCPDHMLDRLRGRYTKQDNAGSLLALEAGSKLEAKTSKQQMASSKETAAVAAIGDLT